MTVNDMLVRIEALEHARQGFEQRLSELEQGDEPDMGGMIDFVDLLVKTLSREQLDQVEQAISNSYVNNKCPVCKLEKDPRDKQGNRIRDTSSTQGQDIEWHEVHEIDCPGCLIPEMRK